MIRAAVLCVALLLPAPSNVDPPRMESGLAFRAGNQAAAVAIYRFAAAAHLAGARKAATRQSRGLSVASTQRTIGQGVPCGGAYPSCCIVARESGGKWNALNPVSLRGEPRGAGGAWQIIPSTWAAWGGLRYAQYADLAPPEGQMAIARYGWAHNPQAWRPLC